MLGIYIQYVGQTVDNFKLGLSNTNEAYVTILTIYDTSREYKLLTNMIIVSRYNRIHIIRTTEAKNEEII